MDVNTINSDKAERMKFFRREETEQRRGKSNKMVDNYIGNQEKSKDLVVGRIMAAKDIPVLIPVS